MQAIIKQIFEKEELQRTLNAIETVARGAALNSAMMTPHFNVQAFTMNDYNNLPVTVKYQFTDPETGEKKEPKEYRNFFDKGQKFPLVQQLKFDNKVGGLTLNIDYSEHAELMQGLPASIACYTVGTGTRKKADMKDASTKLAIRVKNNAHQIPELERVELTECWTEEEKIPIKTAGGVKAKAEAPKEDKKEGEAEGEKPAEEPVAAAAEPEEQKFEIKQRKKERTSEVSFKTISHATPPDMKVQFKGLEDQLWADDRKILDLKEAKYVLESFTYEMKNGVAEYGNYEHYIEPSLKPTFLENLLATEEWIYADGENAPLEEQRARLEALQSIGNPIKARWRFRNEFEDYVSIYQKFRTKATAQMAEVAHLTDEQRNQINDKCAVLEQHFMELRSQLETKPKHEDIGCTLSQLDNKQMLLEAEVNAILSSKPPAPKKEEEKKEEGAEEGKAEEPAADAEMKDEGKTEGEAGEAEQAADASQEPAQ